MPMFLRRYSPGTLFVLGLMIPLTLFLIVQAINEPLLFVQTLLRAFGLGAVYALIALGFVLIFKATQTVNFAQGALAVSGAAIGCPDEHADRREAERQDEPGIRPCRAIRWRGIRRSRTRTGSGRLQDSR